MRLGIHSQRPLGGGDLVGPERRAVGPARTRVARRAFADNGAAANQRRFLRLGLRRGDRPPNGPVVVTVDELYVPAVGLEALRHVFRERQRCGAIDGDLVVVIQRDKLAEFQMPGQRGRLGRDALHQTAVAREHERVVVHQVGAQPRGQEALRQRHADAVGEALAERTRRGLDSGRVTELRVTSGGRAPLAKVLQILQLERRAREVQSGVQQHRAMPVRQNDAIAVGPVGCRRVELELVLPEHRGDVGHAHRRAGVPRIGRLNRVHGEPRDSVGAELIDWGQLVGGHAESGDEVSGHIQWIPHDRKGDLPE